MAETGLLEARELEFSYPDGTPALAGVSARIFQGSRVAVLGPNGAGKTTFFLHLNGTLRPRRGEVRLAGAKIKYTRKYLRELRHTVGIVFQDPDTQLFSASVAQDVSFGPVNLGLPPAEVRERVEQALEATGIVQLRHRPTHSLSYGEKKRAALAGVLAMRPRVLVCDEPLAFLDPRGQEELMELLEAENRRGTTVVIATHDVNLAYAWADQVLVMDSGQVIGAGGPREVFQAAGIRQQAGLPIPWVLEVYQELERRGWTNGNSPPRRKEELLALIRQAGR